MKSIILITLLIGLQASNAIVEPGKDEKICLSAEEKKLYDLIMKYRKSKGLPSIPFSAKLTLIAQAHARDLAENYIINKNECNPHSWSDKGKWTACCYTSDHKYMGCMQDKPKEIAQYNSPGYEIVYYSSRGATAEEGLAGWKKSPAHNPVIINQDVWKQAKWKAIGIGLYKEWGAVWFGQAEDASALTVCK